MVMSGSHVLDENPKQSQIRVSETTVFSHHTPLKIILLDVSSSWKAYDSSDVSLRKYFHHLSVDVHQPLYHNLFTEGNALAIVSNNFYCFPTSTVCQHT